MAGFFSGAESTGKIVEKETMTPEQKALFDTLTKQAQAGLAGPAPSAPQSYVPQTEQESKYFDMVNAPSQAYQDILAGKPGYDVGTDAMEALWQGKYEPQFAKEKALMTEGLAGLGELSSSARGIAEGEFATGKASKYADLMYQEEQARRKALDEAYGRVVPATTARTSELGTAGQYSRSIQQEEIASNLQRFLSGEEVDGKYNPAYNPNMQLALTLMNVTTKYFGSETDAEGGGAGSSMLGAAGGAIGAAAAAAAAA